MPHWENFLKSNALDLSNVLKNPPLFFSQLFDSIFKIPRYFYNLTFQEFSETSYTEAIKVGDLTKFINYLIVFNTALLIVSIVAFSLLFIWFKTSSSSIGICIILIIFCLLVSSVINIPKHWYDSGYLYALLSIAAIFFVGNNYSKLIEQKFFIALLIYFFIISIFSQLIFTNRYLKSYINGYVGPGMQIGIYEKLDIKKSIKNALEICLINSIDSKNLIIDDVTYLYFQKTKFPMPITYLWVDSNEVEVDKVIYSTNSDGIIVHCSSLPEKYINIMQKSGPICCVSKQSLQNSLSSIIQNK